ncbi:MAG: anaerobic sulfatase maturase [Oscillospiraceae bacterium]
MPPLTLMIKPASGLCNLRCKYCFYADEMQKRATPSFGIMSPDTLSCVLQKAFSHADGPVSLIFQGGEPTLAGLDFFRQAVSFTAQYNTKKLPVSFSLQTNGIALDEQWAAFFAENRFLIGLSLDGTQPVHDKNRVCPDGSGSFDMVMDRVALLRRFGVEFNILTVVTRQTAGSIGRIYRFFQEQGLLYQQYIPCLDPLGEARGQRDYSLTPEKYESFLKILFDRWYRDVSQGKPASNRYFENLVGMLLLQPPESCGMLGRCTEQNVVEADGSVYPCDFYVLDQYRLGNLCTDSFADLQRRRRELGFIEASAAIHPDCQACKWFPICRGGCRRDREQPDGTLGKNYFCSAYQGFFKYAMPRLEELARRVQAGHL